MNSVRKWKNNYKLCTNGYARKGLTVNCQREYFFLLSISSCMNWHDADQLAIDEETKLATQSSTPFLSVSDQLNCNKIEHLN